MGSLSFGRLSEQQAIARAKATYKTRQTVFKHNFKYRNRELKKNVAEYFLVNFEVLGKMLRTFTSNFIYLL